MLKRLYLIIAGLVFTTLSGCKKQHLHTVSKVDYENYGVQISTGDKSFDQDRHIVKYKYTPDDRLTTSTVNESLFNDDQRDSLINPDSDVFKFEYSADNFKRHSMDGNRYFDTTFYPLATNGKIQMFFDNRNPPYHEYDYYYHDSLLQRIKIKEFAWVGENKGQLEQTNIISYKYKDAKPITISDSTIMEEWYFADFIDHRERISVINYSVTYYDGDENKSFNANVYRACLLSLFPGMPSCYGYDRGLPEYILQIPDKLIKSLSKEYSNRPNEVYSFSYSIDSWGDVTKVSILLNGKRDSEILIEYNNMY
jgi:hypothetical protein